MDKISSFFHHNNSNFDFKILLIERVRMTLYVVQ